MKKYKKIVINGKFLSQNITGVQRYAREILAELDKLTADSPEIVLLADKNARDIPEYQNIHVVRHGALSGNLWEQLALPAYVLKNRALCVNLCNMVPVLTPHVAVLHDVSFKVNRRFFAKKFTLWYGFVFGVSARRICRVITDSDFSRREISRCYGIPAEDISLLYCGWQHYQRIDPAPGALEKYRLADGQYYFAISSMAPTKNFRWIAQCAARNPDTVFAVSGAVNSKVFGDIFDFDIPSNLRFLGYVSDSEAKALTQHCRAFLFPSYYEGFGIPPLEALSAGAQAVVSDRSCLPEIFGDHVHYVSPDDPDIDLDRLLAEPCREPSELLDKYSWKKSAAGLLDILSGFF